MKLGTDIIEVDRIRANINRYGARFLEKILTPFEASHCSRFQDPAPHVAGRFAAKEAVAKALGCGFGAHLEFHDIEILNAPSGEPFIQLSKQIAIRFDHPEFVISISHCKTHAIATVIKK